MHKLNLAATLLPTIAVALASSAFAAPAGNSGADRVRVVVAYKDGQRGPAQRAIAMSGAEVHYDFSSRRAYAVTVPAAAIEGLSRHPAVEYVEPDPKRYPMAQTVPYGIGLVGATGMTDDAASNTTVCIIDSGIDGAHEDHARSRMSGSWNSGTGNWYTDENSHGTHVAGTIAALNNAVGVVGVLPGGNLNLRIVKVFDANGWAYSSGLVAALDDCLANRGTNRMVVNMSLGGSIKSRFEDVAFADAYNNKGVLSVAAAGNDGNSRNSYPASYSSVISVAAIDQVKQRASFSQYNSQVELAAPGVGVLSTVPMGTGRDSSLAVNGSSRASAPMDGSVVASASGPMRNCDLTGGGCDGAVSGMVCLIPRGTYSFADKAQACRNAGGAAAVIYNNAAGLFYGTLGDAQPGIPVVSISQADGQALAAIGTKTANVAVTATNYAYFDGTSMATPHVAGVAALIWSLKPECSNAAIRHALGATAEDIQPAGRDVYTGFGLVRAGAARAHLDGGNCGLPPPSTGKGGKK